MKGGNFGQRPPGVGIAKVGNITLNPKAYELLGNPSYVHLEFDGKLRIIPGAGQYAVKVNREGKQYRINSRLFVKEHQLQPSNGKAYPAEMQRGVMVIDVAI